MARTGEVTVNLRLNTAQFDAALGDVRERLYLCWEARHPVRARAYRVWAWVRGTEPWRLR